MFPVPGTQSQKEHISEGQDIRTFRKGSIHLWEPKSSNSFLLRADACLANTRHALCVVKRAVLCYNVLL